MGLGLELRAGLGVGISWLEMGSSSGETARCMSSRAAPSTVGRMGRGVVGLVKLRGRGRG